ncbi:hypothetical protein ACSBR2_021912 [Camellia fascicularis]
MGVLGNDENRTDKTNLLVQFPSTSIDYIPQQQPSLAGNGKSVESSQMGVLGNDENKTGKANLLVQFPSTSIDYIPQQQPSLASKGKSVESSQMGVLGNDENRIGKANLSLEGSGNESLVEFPSTSIDYNPQQKPPLASNGKSIKSSQMCISGIDENIIDKANLSAQGSGNESLVQYPSMSIDDIPQRQPSLPPFSSILVEFDSFKAENEMDVLLNETWKSTSPQIF